MSDLEAVLNGEPYQPEPAPEPEVPVEAEAAADEQIQPEVAELTGEEETSTPEAKTENPVEEGLMAGIKAERQKRQEEQLRNKQLQEQLQALQQQQPKPDFWENPEGILQGMQQQFQAQIHKTQTDMSVELMRSLHDDYDDKEAKFIDMAQSNPMLIHQMNQSSNPAKFAYDYVNQQEKLAQMQDPSYEEKLRAEIKAELQAEMQGKVDAELSKRSSLPGTLTNDRAAGGNKPMPYQSPALTSILPE